MAAKSDKSEKSVEKTADKTPEKAAGAGADPKVAAARERELDAAISSITKAYGEGAIMRLGDARAQLKIEVIPTGGLAIDLALGVGGIPRGRVIEIFGPESSGKTTLMLHVIANAQKAGGLAAFIDAEHALDPGYAKKLGVNLDDLLVSQPDSGEEALTICETLARSNALDVIVIDSVAALVPKAELEGERPLFTEGVEEDLLDRYNRLFKSKNGIALVTVEHGVCAGCHMQVNTQTILEVKAEKEIIGCPQCGRILYEPQ